MRDDVDFAAVFYELPPLMHGYIAPAHLRPFFLSDAVERIALSSWKRVDDIEDINAVHFPRLKHLSIGPTHKNKQVTMKNKKRALDSIASLTMLQTLRLSSLNAIKLVLSNPFTLKPLSNLRCLVLEGPGGGSHLTKMQASRLGKAFSPSLEVLKLESMGIDDACCSALVQSANIRNSRISVLSLSGNPVSEIVFITDNAKRLFGMVTTLNLSWTECTAELPRYLQFMQRLKSLDLSFTKTSKHLLARFTHAGTYFAANTRLLEYIARTLALPNLNTLCMSNKNCSFFPLGEKQEDFLFEDDNESVETGNDALPSSDADSDDDEFVSAWMQRIAGANLSEHERNVGTVSSASLSLTPPTPPPPPQPSSSRRFAKLRRARANAPRCSCPTCVKRETGYKASRQGMTDFVKSGSPSSSCDDWRQR